MMPLPTTSLAALARHLEEVGVTRGMDVVVHSRLLSFGSLERGAEGALEVLLDRIGSAAVLAVPTYTFQLGPEDVYDAAVTPAPRMGAFASAVIGLTGSRRGPCPIHNHVYIGGDGGVDTGDVDRSMGPRSSFARMLEAGFHLLLLGTTMQLGATFVHHVEAELGVAYREWLLLPRQVLDGAGRARRVDVHYFARRPSIDDATVDLGRLEAMLVTQNLFRRAQAPMGSSSLIGLPELDRATRMALEADPRILLR